MVEEILIKKVTQWIESWKWGKKKKKKKRKDVTKWVKPCRIRLHNERRIIIFISINWSVLNISHLRHIPWHHVAKKTHVPPIASLKPVNRNAILSTWNVLLLCFWWISCRSDGKNLLTALLLAKSFHFSNVVDYFLPLMLYYERLSLRRHLIKLERYRED